MVLIRYSIISFCLLICLPVARAAVITVTPEEWKGEDISAGDLVSGAGSDLKPSYESGPVAAAVLNITGGIGQKVTVRRLVWSPACESCTLAVRKIGEELYVQIPSEGSSELINSISSDPSEINCQYKLGGISIAVVPDTYTTEVTYTVTAP